jgi:hypothetical protein
VLLLLLERLLYLLHLLLRGGEIACAPPPVGEAAVSSVAYPHVVAAA